VIRFAAVIIDTFALLAILRAEPDALDCARLWQGLHSGASRPANYVEAAAVIDAGRDPVASRRFDELLRELQCVIEPVTQAPVRLEA
jgi:ribonuclease VapC